ncbi:hypothetical protein [Tautonia marina]|uniref:hypothetical protein n=1 Tax=Tautonia marina TaxID=2653855 RepID=UPI001260D991|nr:hypothetical protein [Tautonia marina]
MINRIARRRLVRSALASSMVIALTMGLIPDSAWGQMSVRRRPLGGYGAATIARSYRMDKGAAYIPYGGGFGGYIAQRVLEPTSPVASVTTPQPSPRTAIGGTSMARTPIGGASRMRERRLVPSAGSMGMTGMIRSPAVGRPGVMPPRLSSPFGSPSVLGGG